MDLKSLLSPTETKRDPPKPHKVSSISSLVNEANESKSSDESSIKSPILTNKSTAGFPVPVTPASNQIHIDIIKARNSISSLTNETDVDVDGKETPSIARRLSYEVSTSESNSPVLPKKTLPRQPSLQDTINIDKPIEFEEPVYDEDGVTAAKQDKKHRAKTAKKKQISSSPSVTKSKPVSPSNKIPDDDSKSQTHPSSKKAIDEELNLLTNLEKTEKNGTGDKKKRPRRYSKPPIWATKWIPISKQLTYNAGPNGHVNYSNNSKLDDYSVSIIGKRPYNDLTRRISGWIYSQIYSVPKEQRQFLELEVKFGKIWEKQTDRRVKLPITTEALLDDGYALQCYFKAGLDKDHFEKIKKNLTDKTKLGKEQYKTLRMDHVDKQYREGSREQIPKYFRITTDKQTGRIMANIEKKKLSSILISCPDLLYDFRVTISVELPSSENPERFENHIPESVRQKKRTSFFHDLSSTRFDLTSVQQKTKGRDSNEINVLEVELEIDINKLLDAYNRLETDDITFERLHETVLDNARILNRDLVKNS